jgi:glutamate N-acetyltransferase / amino-acid N-acetyltransferase
VRDGEGARRVIEVAVRGARSDAEARLVGNAVMTSLLVKTTFHGAQLNWGRVAAAVGRSGAEIDPALLSISIGDVVVAQGCVGVPEAYDRAQPLLDGDEVPLGIDLGLGTGAFTGWASDLGEEYVAFNSGLLT